MNDIFYQDWLTIGQPANKYKGKYETVEIAPSDTFVMPVAPLVTLTSGNHCRFGNRLRNGNCYNDFDLTPETELETEIIDSTEIISLYNCGDNLLVKHRGYLDIIDPGSHKQLARLNWSNNRSSLFCFDNKFLGLDNNLQEFTDSGKLLSKTFISGARDLLIQEISVVKDTTVIAGLLSEQSHPDGLPGNYPPLGMLRTIPPDGFSSPDEPDEAQDVAKSNSLAFLEQNVLLPVYLDEAIIQPLHDRIAVLAYDLEIKRVLTGKFEPLGVSAGLNSMIYAIVETADTVKFMALTIDGILAFTSPVNSIIGEIICPPATATNGQVYVIGTDGAAAYDQAGEFLWLREFPGGSTKTVFPLLFNDNLVATFDNRIMAFNPQGEEIFNFSGLPGKANSPLLKSADGKYFIGTNAGLMELIQQ